MNNFKKYLPSKKFIAIILIIVVFIALFFTVKETISLFMRKKGIHNNVGTLIETTPSTVIQKDSNSNGIPDFEEYLWGLDPTKNGSENKDLINAKRKALTDSGAIIPDDSKTITDNDILARQFLATIISLQQTGNLSQESLNSISEAIGKNIEATPISDIYKSTDLVIKNDSTETKNAYLNAYNDLVTKYADKDMGSELTVISQGLGSNDPQALYVARTIASAYISFSSEFIKIPVPSSIASIHLDLANNYNKTGQAIGGLTQILTDPIIGMRSIINYKNYSDAMVADIEKLSGILQ